MTPRPVPPVIPGWKILGYVGAGGMATVWKARRADGTVAAIKVHRAVTTHGATGTESLFRRESLACLNVVHPNLVRGLDAGTTADGSPFLALEFVAGETLDAALKRSPRLDEARILAIGLGLARALDHAHRMGLVHRDVKPRNVMLEPSGGVKLLDLGLVVETAEGAGTHRFGTFGFTAPEVMRGEKPAPRSDLFMLGVTLAMAATGIPPSKERGFEDRMMKEIGGGELAPGLARVLERLVKSDPSQRYGSAAELVLDLESLTAGERPLGAILGASGAAVVRKGPRVAAIAGVAILAAGVVAWVMTRSEPAPDLSSLDRDPVPAPPPRALDPRLSAAKLYMEQFPSDFARSRELLEAADTPALSDGERSELEAARAALAARFDAAASAALERLQANADAALAEGDVQRARDAFAAWPDAFHDAPQAKEAAKRADACLADARAKAAALLELAMDTLKAPPSGENARVAKLLEEALARKPFGGDRRSELEEFRAALAARVAATTRQEAASRARQAAEEATNAALLAHATAPSPERFAAALAAAQAESMPVQWREDALHLAAVLARAETALRTAVSGLAGKRWCGPIGRSLFVGTVAAAPSPEEVFLSGLWSETGGRAHTLARLAGGQEEAGVWLLSRGMISDAECIAREGGALDRICQHLGGRHGTTGSGDELEVAPRWELVVRDRTQSVRAYTGKDPVIAAWSLAAAGQRQAPSKTAPVSKAKGRDAFLADDFATAWTCLSEAEALDPWDAEIAALRGRVALTGGRALPNTPAFTRALMEGCRAWDLDPKLPAGPVLAAEAGIALIEIQEDLYVRPLRPVVAAACEAADSVGRAEARMLAFAGEWRLASGDAANAVKLLRRAATKAADSVAIHVSLARAELASGSKERAKTAFRRARELSGGAVPEGADDLARVLGE